MTLISAQLDANMLTGNLTSVITIKVTNNNVGKHIYCSDGQISQDDPPSLVIPAACKSTPTYHIILFLIINSIAINACADNH